MNGPVGNIGVAAIELAGGEALLDAIGQLRGEAGALAGVCRDEAPDVRIDGVEWVASAGETVPVRRRRGGEWLLSEAGADPLVLIEDTTDLAEGWAEALSDRFEDPSVGCVWGPVEISPALAPRFRALGRLEYGRFASGDRTLPAPPGNALALRASLLERHLNAREVLVEAELPETLAAAGLRMEYCPDFRAVYARRDPHGARLSTRFQHGRIYGSGVAARTGAGGRAALALKSLLVPAVLSLRGLKAALSGGGAGTALAEAGWIVSMSLAWGLGECAGALFGPGQSEGSWR